MPVAKAGAQHITYAEVDPGGGGGLVGPGAAPSSAPTAALASGSGVESGAHDYAVTFETAAGESLPGPSATITVGEVSAPSSAPTAGTPTSGDGPDDGTHQYAVTFVTSAGETTPSALSNQITTSSTGGPSTAPALALATGGSIDLGAHQYAVTFVTSSGETAPGPTASITTTSTVEGAVDPIDPPADDPSMTFPAGSSSLMNGVRYRFAMTYRRTSDGAETTIGPVWDTGTGWPGGLRAIWHQGLNTDPPTGYTRRLYRSADGGTYKHCDELTGTGFFDSGEESQDAGQSDASLGANAPTTNTTGSAGTTVNRKTVNVTGIATGPTGTTARKIYRTIAGGSQLKLLTTISNNSTTSYTDTAADSSLGVNAPAGSAYTRTVALTGIPTGAAIVTARKLYRTAAGGAQLKLLATIADNSTTTFSDTTADASLGANVPTTNTATANQVALSGIPVGEASVTGRKIYRTEAAGSQLKLLTTIADNSTTTFTDTAADASLGANVPTTDTSGLSQPEGQVLPGSTSIIVANAAAFREGGGWAVIGNGQQVIRYTGKTANAVTGVPASGAGSITAAIGYNSTITTAPILIGIPASGEGSIQYAIHKGDDVNLLVTVDDTDAQATLAALFDDGSDGVVEDFLQDRRLSREGALELGAAHLALRSDVLTSLRYRCRDPKTKSGRTITVNLPAPTNVNGTFKIQRVTISKFHPSLFPTHQVEASNEKYSFEDLLRRAARTSEPS